MTLGVDAGGGATAGPPPTARWERAVQRAAAEEERGAPVVARAQAAWVAARGRRPYCVIRVPVGGNLHAASSSTLADESKFVSASRVQPGRWKMQEPSSSSA